MAMIAGGHCAEGLAPVGQASWPAEATEQEQQQREQMIEDIEEEAEYAEDAMHQECGTELPEEIWLNVLARMPSGALGAVRQVSRLFYRLTSDYVIHQVCPSPPFLFRHS
jgi:hypothetical protein